MQHQPNQTTGGTPAFRPVVPGGQMPLAQNIRPGGFWIRFVASIIDSIIVSIVNYPLGMVVGVAMGAENVLAAQGVAALLGFGVTALYFGYFYTTKGASLGKLVFNMRVVNHSTGTKLTWGQAILRETIGKLLSSITLLIGYIMAGVRGDKRALHDLIAGSQVLRKMN